MVSRLQSVTAPKTPETEALVRIATHCRQVAREHMTLAEQAEALMPQFFDDRRLRLGLRSFARHQRRVAWKHMELALRAEAVGRGNFDDFDISDLATNG